MGYMIRRGNDYHHERDNVTIISVYISPMFNIFVNTMADTNNKYIII